MGHVRLNANIISTSVMSCLFLHVQVVSKVDLPLRTAGPSVTTRSVLKQALQAMLAPRLGYT